MPKRYVDATWIINGLIAFLVIAGGLFLYNQINIAILNSQYITLGKSVNCVERPNWEAMQRCNAAREGVACMHETQTELASWYDPIDYACSKSEPERPFVFPAYSEPEAIEVASTE